MPGAPAKGITTENIGGNMLVIDIGGGHYAFYAHLQPGSLKVKLGDKVKTWEVLALWATPAIRMRPTCIST